MTSQEKLKAYERYLKKPYWELQEGIAFIKNITNFGLKISIEDPWRKAFGCQSYNFGPIQNDPIEAIDKNFLSIFVDAIHNKEIKAYPINYPECIELRKGVILRAHTYLVEPYELLSYVVTTGMILPNELQLASGLYQTNKVIFSKKNGWIKQAQREAFIQSCWYKNPNDSCSELVRKILRFKAEIRSKIGEIQKKSHLDAYQNTQLSKLKAFDYLYDSPKRLWAAAKPLQPKQGVALTFIPGVVEKNKNITCVDFKHLKVIVKTIATLLLFKREVQSTNEVLDHPLINQYTIMAGSQIRKVIQFCLREEMKHLSLLELYSY